jgi:gamma-glutamyl-gamma-aminobutyrate hydrolase PuuD
MTIKILYSALYGGGYPFDSLCETTVTVKKPEDITDPDSILVIWGGSDINPDLYNHPHSRTTGPSASRDVAEWALLNRAVELGIPTIGVCRGAQMLCARAGGFLIQDVSNHAGSLHKVLTHTDDEVTVNSIHHQMLAGLEKVPHELLAWCDTPRSPKYIYRDDKDYVPPEGFKEPELVWFPKIKGFAIQWHPEGMNIHSEATNFVFKEMYNHGIGI